MTDDERDQIVERIRERSQKVEEALFAVLDLPPDEHRSAQKDPAWVSVPLLMPTVLAALMALLAESSGHDVSHFYVNVLLRGLWALGTEEDVTNVSRSAALLIHAAADTETWESWSARYPLAREYVAEAKAEQQQEGAKGEPGRA